MPHKKHNKNKTNWKEKNNQDKREDKKRQMEKEEDKDEDMNEEITNSDDSRKNEYSDPQDIAKEPVDEAEDKEYSEDEDSK